TITAVSPATAGATLADVVVGTPGSASHTTVADQFVYADLPTVTGVSPSAGPTGGGTIITITGTNFTAGAQVGFGETANAPASVGSSTSLTAVTPPWTSGAVDLIVRTASGASPT